MPPHSNKLSDADYARLGDFRYAVRRFLEFSKDAASSEGLTPQQHQALLVIRACPSAIASVGHLAERLCIRPNTAVGLVDRLESAGLVSRSVSDLDRRQVELSLTDLGSSKLEKLSHVHRQELRQLSPEMMSLLANLETETSA